MESTAQPNRATQSPPQTAGAPADGGAFGRAEWRLGADEAPPVTGSELSCAGYPGSMQQVLQQNAGCYVVCEFLLGTHLVERKEGLLFSVGDSYLVLYEPPSNRYILCDIYALKFVTFHEPGIEPAG